MSARWKSMEPRTSARFSRRPVSRLSMTTTRAAPSRSRPRTNAEPMKPAPPVTTYFLIPATWRFRIPGGGGIRSPGARRRERNRRLRARPSRDKRGGAAPRGGLEVVVAGATVPAIEFLHMHVADEVVMRFHEAGVRDGFVDGVVDVEHGADGGVVDLPHEAGGLIQGLDHVTLADGERLDQDGDAAGGGMGSYRNQAVHKMARGLGTAEAAGGGALKRRAEDHQAAGAEIGAEIDQVVDVLPTALAQRGIGGGDVQALGTDHQPVQAHEDQPLGGDDVTDLS